jgi:hypothetical protein
MSIEHIYPIIISGAFSGYDGMVGEWPLLAEFGPWICRED